MDQAIGQGQIADGIVILMAVEIICIVGESLSQSMTIIEHRRDAIETETIKWNSSNQYLQLERRKWTTLSLP